MLETRYENPMAIRSKNALSEALLKLMMYKPFRDVTVSDITGRAGLSRQTFYTNFQKKEDILIYLIQGLFRRYLDKITQVRPVPENLLIDYFLFWGDSREFLTLLYKQDMGYLFQECNRAFFLEDTDLLNDMFTCEEWQLPYIKASIAGVTHELLFLWLTRDQGLSVDRLGTMTRNLLGGRLFAK